jgi:isopentenyl-diphosphate Delta-isomerase
MATNTVILVDENDQAIGEMEKMEAHKKGLLHRAFSVFVFNDKDELLLQRRALEKYHSGGLWTNTCCSHPGPNQNLEKAIKERLVEEMGFSTDVEKRFSFIYKYPLDNDLIEHELDHVYFAYSNEKPKPNPNEVMDFKYISLLELQKDIQSNPEKYTKWLVHIFDDFLEDAQEFLSK